MFMDPGGSSRLLQNPQNPKFQEIFVKNPKNKKPKNKNEKGKSWTSWPPPGSQGPPRFPDIF
jgi:hypothetical protein